MYTLLYSRAFLRQLKRLDAPVRERIISALERIRIRPGAFVVRIIGYPAYKLRVGDYRVILDIEKERLLILVLKVGHRRSIYKRL